MDLRVICSTDKAVSQADLLNAASRARIGFGGEVVCERTDEVSIVATDGEHGDFVGHASVQVSVLVCEDTGLEAIGDAYLSSLFVAKQHRRLGVGRELMHRIERRLRERGCTHLWTQTAGYDGHGFYRKRGYEQLFDLPGFFQSGHSHIGFQLDLRLEPHSSMGRAASGDAMAHFAERSPTPTEQCAIDSGFVEHAQAHNCPLLEEPERFEVVGEPVGCSESDLAAGYASGLAYSLVADGMNGEALATNQGQKCYRKDYVMTDLFVDLPYRRRGVGRQLLHRLEARVFALRGVARIHAWIPASAQGAYALLLSEGYSVVCERLPSRAMLLQKMRSSRSLAEVAQPEPEHEALSQSLQLARTFLGKHVEVTIDRPLGSVHPTHDFRYEQNYGFIADTLAPDGEELDAYFLGEDNPIYGCASGQCIAIVHRRDDDDDKLVVVPTAKGLDAESLNDDADMGDEEIIERVRFQEQWFDSVVVRS